MWCRENTPIAAVDHHPNLLSLLVPGTWGRGRGGEGGKEGKRGEKEGERGRGEGGRGEEEGERERGTRDKRQ